MPVITVLSGCIAGGFVCRGRRFLSFGPCGAGPDVAWLAEQQAGDHKPHNNSSKYGIFFTGCHCFTSCPTGTSTVSCFVESEELLFNVLGNGDPTASSKSAIRVSNSEAARM